MSVSKERNNQERKEEPKSENGSKAKPINDRLAFVLVAIGGICSLVAAWAAVKNHQTMLTVSVIAGIFSFALACCFHWIPSKEHNYNTIALDDSPHPQLTSPLPSVHASDKRLTGIEEAPPEPPRHPPLVPQSIIEAQERSQRDRPAQMIQQPRPACDKSADDMDAEALDDEQRLIVYILFQRGGSMLLHMLPSAVGIEMGNLKAKLLALDRSKYIHVDWRSHGNRSKVNILPKGQTLAKQEESPTPVRPLDPVPVWPPPLSEIMASRAFLGSPPWTQYTMDSTFRDGLIWTWRYDERLNDGVPRELTPLCPECGQPIDGRRIDCDEPGLYIKRLECPSHPSRQFDVIGDTLNGDYSSIKRRVILRIRDGSWEYVVLRQRGR